MTSARVLRLSLTNFRNYHAASLEAGARTMVLVGPNGAGKTNLIEAISFLAPGRGLRRATLDEVAFAEGDGSWAVSAEIEGALGLATLGTGIERPLGEDTASLRKFRIDREPAPSAAAFADHLRVVWLVPAMDGLFAGAPSERRRFLDRMALAVDAEHGSRINALERALRSRNRLLEDAAPRSRIGSTPWSTRPRSLRLRSPDYGLKRYVGSMRCCEAARTRPFRRPRLRSTAGWRSSSLGIPPARSRSVTAPYCATIAPATPLPDARSTARI